MLSGWPLTVMILGIFSGVVTLIIKIISVKVNGASNKSDNPGELFTKITTLEINQKNHSEVMNRFKADVKEDFNGLKRDFKEDLGKIEGKIEHIITIIVKKAS